MCASSSGVLCWVQIQPETKCSLNIYFKQFRWFYNYPKMYPVFVSSQFLSYTHYPFMLKYKYLLICLFGFEKKKSSVLGYKSRKSGMVVTQASPEQTFPGRPRGPCRGSKLWPENELGRRCSTVIPAVNEPESSNKQISTISASLLW